jgi:hypothetical protein
MPAIWPFAKSKRTRRKFAASGFVSALASDSVTAASLDGRARAIKRADPGGRMAGARRLFHTVTESGHTAKQNATPQ